MLTIKQQAELMGLALQGWCTPRGGVVKILENQRQVWQEVRNTSMSDEPRVLLCFSGDTLRLPDQPSCNRVDRKWMVVVMRGKGFQALVDDSRAFGADVGKAINFYDVIESLRDCLRVVLNVSDDEEMPGVRYIGSEPFPASPGQGLGEDAMLDCFVLRFMTGNDIPAVTLEAPEQ
jgi:hypothetical protein